jgi:hypothetical protein
MMEDALTTVTHTAGSASDAAIVSTHAIDVMMPRSNMLANARNVWCVAGALASSASALKIAASVGRVSSEDAKLEGFGKVDRARENEN